MKKMLLLPVVALALAACGQSGPKTPSINVTGQWMGTAMTTGNNDNAAEPAILILSQATDGSITGTFTDASTSKPFPLTGTVASGKLSVDIGDATAVLQGTFTNTTFAGTFITTKTADHSVVASGTFSFTKNQ